MLVRADVSLRATRESTALLVLCARAMLRCRGKGCFEDCEGLYRGMDGVLSVVLSDLDV